MSTPPPHLSPDGRFWWDTTNAQWVPMPTTPGPAATPPRPLVADTASRGALFACLAAIAGCVVLSLVIGNGAPMALALPLVLMAVIFAGRAANRSLCPACRTAVSRDATACPACHIAVTAAGPGTSLPRP